MRAECIDAVNKAAQAIGKKLTVGDLKNIEGKIVDARRQLAKQDIDAYRAMTNEQQIEKAGELVAKQALHDAIKKRQRADLTIIKKAEREAVMGRMIADGIDHLEALRRFTFSVADGKGKVVSFESYSNGLSRYYLGKLTDFNEYVKESSFLGVMTDKKMRDDFEMESFGISSGNPKAKKAWDNLNAVRKEMLEHNNRLGGDIVPLANYRNPQNTSQFLILRRGGKDGKNYIDDHMQWVDRSEYVKPDGTMMDDAELRTFLHEAFITQATDGANKPAGAGIGGSVANRGKAHRQIHYKSPEAYRAAMEKYGAGNSFDQAIQSIESMANDIALMDKFGPNAVHEFNDAYSNAARNSGGRTDELMNSAFKRMSGQISTAHPMVAHYVGELKSAMVASRLGSMLFSQISDLSTMSAAARTMNIPQTELASWIANVAADGNLRDTLRIHGLGVESALNSIVRFAEGATNTGMFGKFATAVPTIQGAHLWTKSLRQAFGAMMEAKVGDMAAKYDSMAKLPETDRKIFEAIGINDTDWAIYRLAKPFEYKGSKLMNSEAIENIPTSELAKAIPDRVAQIRQDAADFIQRMEEKNIQESGWVQNRQTKFAEYKDKIQKMIDDYVSTREKRVEDYSSSNLKRGGEMMARLEQAEVELELTKASIDATNERRADKFAEEVKRGMETYGRRRSEIGETLGAKRHSAKLQAAGADRAYTKLSEQLIAKKNELFGHERVEDGLIVIGELTKAVKELDAYTAKMEKRIANSYQKDGGIKKGKEGTIDRAEKLKDDAKIEYEAIKQSVEGRMNALKEKVTGSQMEIRGIIDSIEAKKNRAEAEADIASYLATEKNADKVQGLLDTLEFRRDQTADRMMSEGERIGYKKAMAEAKVKAMAKREEAYTKTANKEVFSKATELEKRIDKRMNELEELTKSLDDKSTERNKLASEYEARIGKQEEKAIELARRDTALKITAMAIEEAEMAVLQPNLHSKSMLKLHKGEIVSEIGASFFQFKSFAVAMVNQHMMQRASMLDGKLSQAAYRLELLALTSVFGGMGLLMNDLISGKDPREVFDSEDPWVMAKFGKQAILKGGGLSIYGDMLNAVTGENRSNLAESLAGPTLGTFAKTGTLINEAYKEASGKGGNPSFHALKLANEFAMVDSMIWTRAAWNNYLMAELNEMASPGYMSRSRRAADKNYGTEYFAGMGTGLRAPNIANIYEQ